MSYYGETGRGRGRGAITEPNTAASISTGSSGSDNQTLRTGSSSTSGNGNGNGNKFALGKLLRTKPKDLNSKRGKSGATVDLAANYFEMTRKPQFKFMLYRVDFEPGCDNEKLRKVFVSRKLHDFNCGFIYDGVNMIYFTRELPEREYVFDVEDTFPPNQKYKMTIKNTQAVIESTDAMALQIYNIMLRRAMKGLEMDQVGRNLYDAKSKVD
jgi:aubergine